MLLLVGVFVSLCLLLPRPASASALMTTGDGGWFWQDPLPQGNNLEAVSAVDAQHAVAAGDNGSILTTSDGGASWSAHDLGIAGAHVSDLSFVDVNDGWAQVRVQGRNGGGVRAFVAHTSDGGATWAAEGFGMPVTDVDFIDPSHGWVCGGNTIGSTSDGGLTWNAHHVAANSYLNDIVFTDVSHGWAVGARVTDYGAHEYPIILATADGGATWHKQSFPPRDTEEGGLSSVSFVDADRGWAVGNGSGSDGGSIVLATTDGGATWSLQSAGTDDWLSGATFLDAGHGWLAAGSNVLATTDGGATWTSHAVGIPITAVSFADDLHGYAVGSGGGLATTSDGGASWQVQSTTTPAAGVPSLSDIAFPDAMHGWAVGSDIILATADGGTTWNAQTTASGLTSVSFPDAGHGWAVGGGGFSGGVPVILHTSDGGLSWQTQYTGTNGSPARFTDVDFIDANHGWAAGSSAAFPSSGDGHPTVGATSDGGAHWKFVELRHVYGAVNAVSFVDAKHGWLVASIHNFADASPSGIFATSDGGLTWKRQYSAHTKTALLDITLADRRHGWAVGEADNPKGSCLVLTTTDGGATWSRQNLSAYGSGGLHVTFTDLRHGWVVCGSTVHATVDGGRHWWTERPGSEVRAVAFTDPSHGWAVVETGDWTGGGGGILMTTTGGFSLAPVTTVSGADLLWHRRAVHLAFTAVDEPGGAGMVGGQAKIETKVDDGAWTTRAKLTITAPANHSNDGVHLVFYRSTDAAGNTGTARDVIVRIDTRGPTTTAQAAAGTRGHAISLRYFVADTSPRAKAIRLIVRNAGGIVVTRFTPRPTSTNEWHALKWRPSLKGRYSYAVYAKDSAGNAQVRVGRAEIKVR
jgi:photosystem II stability/assembly factor-like uncharacterized protein